MAKVVRKCRTREHVIADLSVHHVEGHVLRCGWVIERIIQVTNVVTPAAVRRFARFRDRVVAQIREVVHHGDATDPLR